jgi:hypothetical protein
VPAAVPKTCGQLENNDSSMPRRYP